MKKILVTGAGGFLGSAVIERLAKLDKYVTTAVISGRHPVEFPSNIHVKTANLLNENEREELMRDTRPDIILHLAWGLVGKDFWYSEENLTWWVPFYFSRFSYRVWMWLLWPGGMGYCRKVYIIWNL